MFCFLSQLPRGSSGSAGRPFTRSARKDNCRTSASWTLSASRWQIWRSLWLLDVPRLSARCGRVLSRP